MPDIDTAKDTFDAIISTLNPDTLNSEQDARFQLINRLLTEVLGWSYSSISTEPHSESGYTAYVLPLPAARRSLSRPRETPLLSSIRQLNSSPATNSPVQLSQQRPMGFAKLLSMPSITVFPMRA